MLLLGRHICGIHVQHSVQEWISLKNPVLNQGLQDLKSEKEIGDTVRDLININNSNEFSYRYCISCWIYINYQLPSTNENYTKIIHLLCIK